MGIGGEGCVGLYDAPIQWNKGDLDADYRTATGVGHLGDERVVEGLAYRADHVALEWGYAGRLPILGEQQIVAAGGERDQQQTGNGSQEAEAPAPAANRPAP
jgi:hypothetical protein